MKLLLTKGSAGKEVTELARKLREALGADAAAFPVLAGKVTVIDADFDAAIRRWQAGIGVIADGIIGPRCQMLLGMLPQQGGKFTSTPLNVNNVSQLFPATKPANIQRYLPYIEAALGVKELADFAMTVGALGTIRAETEGFVPIAEFQSRFNTPPGGTPFSSYDLRTDIGNTQAGDGARYRGRGFIQLTGKSNYKTYGERIGIDLLANSELANAPEVAAVVLAEFLADKAEAFRRAIAAGKYRDARKLVNGGSHGLDRFKDVFSLAKNVWPAVPTPATGLAGKLAGPKRAARKPVAVSQRPIAGAAKQSRTKKDAADLRDRLFMPAAISLPDEFPPEKELRSFLAPYTKAGLILDQGREGACTGFGLTCVINYLRWIKAGLPQKFQSVSPRMLYTLARRHDEYEGEDYEGSSCRGALKGWFNNGVCLEEDWPYAPEKSNPAKYGFAERASQHTLGVYYRIDTKSITDMQAAIAQHRAIFVSCYTHDGWDNVPRLRAPANHKALPIIEFDGRPSRDGGHAFALVGFNDKGFILQNSWGKSWGAGGFAVIAYLDWLANGMDAWVASLGVPGVVAGRLAVTQGAASARVSADRTKWWDEGIAYQHSIVLGNDGRVARYLTEDEQPRKLQQQAFALPDAWFRSQGKGPKRLVIYAHGGLNKEADAIKRASAMGRFFAGNGCYPLFLVWKTGLLESIGGILSGTGRPSELAGAGEGFSEQTDLLLEKTVGRPLARPLWSEMKENAELAFAPRRGGELLLDAIQALAETWKDEFELHLVGHSAGSIILGHMLSAMAKRSSPEGKLSDSLKSVHLYAPACTVAFANRHYAGNGKVMDNLYIDLLSDKVERDDNVIAVYRKSLLYFVSNALEADLRTPILGLERVFDAGATGWDGSSDTGETLANWRAAASAARLAERLTRIATDRIHVAIDTNGKPVVDRAGHGSFDNDVGTVERTLMRITGGKLKLPVEDLRGF